MIKGSKGEETWGKWVQSNSENQVEGELSLIHNDFMGLSQYL